MAKYTEAQKEAYGRYVEKNDLVTLSIRIPRKKRDKYHEQAHRQGKSLAKYVTDILDGRE